MLESAGIRGSTAYASVYAHEELEQGDHPDNFYHVRDCVEPAVLGILVRCLESRFLLRLLQ